MLTLDSRRYDHDNDVDTTCPSTMMTTSILPALPLPNSSICLTLPCASTTTASPGQDELKLMRIRTKRHELIITPGTSSSRTATGDMRDRGAGSSGYGGSGDSGAGVALELYWDWVRG